MIFQNKNTDNQLSIDINIDSPKLTQKEAFLKYLQEMNIEMLDLVLSEEATYFGAPKSVFLEKLSYIQNQHLLSGYKEGFKIKQYKKPKNYYALITPFSDVTNKFYIEEKNCKIVRIYNNLKVETKDEVEFLSQFEFFFGYDEKADFRPTTDYIMTLHNCKIAYEELMNDNIQILTKERLSNWINEHASLYEEVDKNFLYFRYNNFRNLYFGLKYIFDMLQFSDVASEALTTFPGSSSMRSKLYEWISKYDRLYFCNVLSVDQDFKDIDLVNKTLKHISYKNFLFKGDDFLSIYFFGVIFHNQTRDSGYYHFKIYRPRPKSRNTI